MLDENESMLSGLIGGLRFMPAYSIMMGRFLNQINQTFPDRVIMLCRLLRVIIYMWDFAEAYFDVPMIIETVTVELL